MKAIDDLREAIKYLVASQTEFRRLMEDADAVADNRTANICEDAANDLQPHIQRLRRRLESLTRLLP